MKEYKIYHITHIQNLSGILQTGKLWSDVKRIKRDLDCKIVGMSTIKKRRLKLPVKCHPKTTVGQFVPFYFCPRSVMLYILHMGNHPELTYRGGQSPIVHLEADLREVVTWADTHRRHWAFSTSNAGARYADFYADLDHLDKINWPAVGARDFRDPDIKDGKQAEFLVHKSFPWHLIQTIGVLNAKREAEVNSILRNTESPPVVRMTHSWYF